MQQPQQPQQQQLPLRSLGINSNLSAPNVYPAAPTLCNPSASVTDTMNDSGVHAWGSNICAAPSQHGLPSSATGTPSKPPQFHFSGLNATSGGGPSSLAPSAKALPFSHQVNPTPSSFPNLQSLNIRALTSQPQQQQQTMQLLQPAQHSLAGFTHANTFTGDTFPVVENDKPGCIDNNTRMDHGLHTTAIGPAIANCSDGDAVGHQQLLLSGSQTLRTMHTTDADATGASH